VRSTLLTPELTERICRALSFGIDVQTACAVEGISRPVFYLWRKRGEKGESPYDDFLTATDQAFARAETRLTASVYKTALDGNWQAGLGLLRLRRGTAAAVQVAGPNGQNMGTMTVLSAAAADEIRHKILYGEDEDDAPETPDGDAAADTGGRP
jgi:hypothetical protein